MATNVHDLYEEIQMKFALERIEFDADFPYQEGEVISASKYKYKIVNKNIKNNKIKLTLDFYE